MKQTALAAAPSIELERAAVLGADELRKTVGRYVWKWYQQNEGETVVQRKILLFKVTITVRDCRPLIVGMFGADPGVELIGAAR